ncbi:hypothetical protein CAPTEDRAFT_194538 [Capitella teleta]|uniref:Uncharacterized protein n=1 Tax=Capitella teleta TaxID=283909 RepID=R7TH61_CAPTE|nr:hypothetical protein CAPTEDRAFT_194538 [Capitella teleta]|eukprot:ELT93044.1 hypothetical protein CAPTEDRAFT_194538 [Capitella teleta]
MRRVEVALKMQLSASRGHFNFFFCRSSLKSGAYCVDHPHQRLSWQRGCRLERKMAHPTEVKSRRYWASFTFGFVIGVIIMALFAPNIDWMDTGSRMKAVDRSNTPQSRQDDRFEHGAYIRSPDNRLSRRHGNAKYTYSSHSDYYSQN